MAPRGPLTQPGQREPQGTVTSPENLQGLEKSGTRQCYHRPRFLVSSLFITQHKVFPLLRELHSVEGMGWGKRVIGGVSLRTQVQAVRVQLLFRISTSEAGPREISQGTLQLK